MIPAPECRTRATRRASSDRGFSLVEILVAIVLIGTVVVSVLVSLQTTIKASAIDRKHAVSFSWLQSASDEIYRSPRVACTSGRPAAMSSYDAAAKSVPRPPAWDSSAVIAVTNVEYLGKTTPDANFEWSQSFCFEGGIYVDSPLYTQRVTIQATSPGGDIVKTIQMIKSK